VVNKIEEEPDHSDDTPPVLGSWGKIYSLVLIVLIALILFFYYFSKAFD
jgi:hypothetical protein